MKPSAKIMLRVRAAYKAAQLAKAHGKILIIDEDGNPIGISNKEIVDQLVNEGVEFVRFRIEIGYHPMSMRAARLFADYILEHTT